MVISRTPYRLSLVGGGSDYPAWYQEHGGCVLSATINRYCHISARWLPPFFPHTNRIVWSKTELVKDRSEIEHPAVRAALEWLDLDGVEIHHDGDLPARSGIGSSSAFAVGLLHALHGLQGQMIGPEELAADAIHLERTLLHEPVGCQDQILCALGGLRLVTFTPDGQWRADPVVLPPERLRQLEDRLLLFYTGPRQASILPGGQNSRPLHRIQAMPQQALTILLGRDLADFGDLLDESWQVKRELHAGISTPDVDALYLSARKAGAHGGKLLGAGGGGFLLLFVEPPFQRSVHQALQDLVHVPFAFENQGSSIVYYRPEPRP